MTTLHEMARKYGVEVEVERSARFGDMRGEHRWIEDRPDLDIAHELLGKLPGHTKTVVFHGPDGKYASLRCKVEVMLYVIEGKPPMFEVGRTFIEAVLALCARA